MPRREDERRLNLSKTHPAACTCKACTDKFHNKFINKQAKKAKRAPKAKHEAVKRHPADCSCPSCSLLKSIDFS